MNLVNQLLKASLNSTFINGLKTIASSPRQIFCSNFHSKTNEHDNNKISTFQSINGRLIVNNKLQTFYLNQKREYKQKVRLRKRCKGCYFVWRCGRLYVECKEHPRHKQHHVTSLLKGFDSVAHGYDKNSPINHLY